MKKRNFLIPLIFSLGVTFLVGAFSFLNIFGTWESKAYDSRMFLQGVQSPRDDIVIVGLTEEDLATLGQWPWPRAYHAKLIEQLTKSGAAAIGMDIIFSEPGRNKEMDQELVVAARKSGKVVMGIYGNFDKESSQSGTMSFEKVNEPFPALAKACHLGIINVTPDNDSILRRSIMKFGNVGANVSSFELELLKLKGIKANNVPTDGWNRMLVNFIGPPNTFPVIPYHQVLSGSFPPDYFQGKIVLVGATALGLHDYYFTPFSQDQMPGIEFHANVLQTLMNKNYKVPMNLSVNLAVIILVAFLSVFVYYYLSSFLPSWVGIVYFIISTLIIAALNIFTFDVYNLYWEIVPPLVTGFLSYLVILFYRYLAEQKEKKKVTQLFGRYVAQEVVNKILGSGDEFTQVGGKREEVTLLFMDIRGFTSLSESLPPEEVVKVVNSFLNIAVEEIFLQEGTLDKFIGDAVMVIYNAPLPLKNHSHRAVKTAMGISKRIALLQDDLFARYGRKIQFGFGINRGDAIVGNIGSSQRMEYTAIGDTVNQAARFESMAGQGEILVSQSVYDVIKEDFEIEFLGERQVKGKAQAVNVYKVLAEK